MFSPQELADIRSDLELFASAPSYEDVTSAFQQRRGVSPYLVSSLLMGIHQYGREQEELDLRDKSVVLLKKKTENIDQRLPWYHVMFRIIDEGCFYSGTDGEAAGPYLYEFSEQGYSKLTQELSRDAGIPSSAASSAVRRLCFDLADMPGPIVRQNGQYSSSLRLNRIIKITTNLHLPAHRLFTVTNEESIADLVYAREKERLGGVR